MLVGAALLVAAIVVAGRDEQRTGEPATTAAPTNPTPASSRSATTHGATTTPAPITTAPVRPRYKTTEDMPPVDSTVELEFRGSGSSSDGDREFNFTMIDSTRRIWVITDGQNPVTTRPELNSGGGPYRCTVTPPIDVGGRTLPGLTGCVDIG